MALPNLVSVSFLLSPALYVVIEKTFFLIARGAHFDQTIYGHAAAVGRINGNIVFLYVLRTPKEYYPKRLDHMPVVCKRGAEGATAPCFHIGSAFNQRGK